jgi:putative ABC transport system permease protein
MLRWIIWLLRRARFEREMRDELRAHIELRADDLVHEGLSREDAVRRARIEFGAVESWKEECRDAGGFASVRPFHGVRADFRLAARRLAAAPIFTLFAVVSLAAGVGVTTAAYSVVSTVFWTDSGIPDPDSGVVIMAGSRVNDPRWILSEADFEDLAAAQRSFSALTASLFILPAVEAPTLTEIQPGEGVDGRYFDLLGVRPHAGRFIQDEDTRPGAAPVIVLSHALWKLRFAEDPAIVGRAVRVNGQLFDVVGVAPGGFQGLLAGPMATRIWMAKHEADALWFRNRSTNLQPRDRRALTVFGRLRPGVGTHAATADVRAIGAALDIRHPRISPDGSRPDPRGWSVRSVRELSNFDGMVSRFGMLLLGLVVLVLAVACTNLANLVLARGTTRHHEIAVRRALGASRWRLVREQTAESVLLALGGGLAAWPVLMVLQSALNIEIPMSRNWLVSIQPEISLPALAVAAAALLLCLVVFGLEPALQLTRRRDVRDELVAAAGSVGVPKVSRQRTLLRWQVAVSTGFFIITSLSVRYLVIEARHDSGMDLDRLAIARVAFGVQRWDEARARAAIDRVLHEARREPGVDAVAASAGLPFGDTATPFALLAHPAEPDMTRKPDGALAMLVTPGFFRATGIALRHGRPIDERDQAGGLPVMVVGEGIARSLFGTVDVVGRQLLVTNDVLRRTGADNEPPTLVTIVGVAEDTDDTHFMLRRGSQIYLPLSQEYSPSVSFIARAARPALGVGALRAATRRAAPDLGLEHAGDGYALLAGPYVFLRTIGMVALTLGGITLLLAMAGLFGVQSHVVGHRTREIGVRMSFGASPAQIRTMVLRDGYKPVLQGLALGLVIGIGGRAVIQSQTPVPIGYVDGWMLVMVPLPLLLAAFFACWLPARRAAAVDPNVALRHL